MLIFVVYIFQVDQQTQEYLSAYSTLCNGGTNAGACPTAISGVNITCVNSLNSRNSSVCSGTCSTQLSAVVSACGNTTVSLICT